MIMVIMSVYLGEIHTMRDKDFKEIQEKRE